MTSRSTRPGIICDTRQQAGKHEHVDGWLSAHGVPFSYRKLDYGDYQRDDGFSNISIDTKRDMQELVGNLGKQHRRFARECDRAAEAGYRLVILVEQHPEYRDRGMLRRWVSTVCRRSPVYRSGNCKPLELAGRLCARGYKPMQGEAAAKIMDGLERDHGVRFQFCDRRSTAKTICDMLGIGYDK